MSWFNSLITAFCTAGICFGAILIISPGGKMEKSVKYVLSLCFLLIIISIAGVRVKIKDFEVDFKSYSSVDIKEIENKTAEYTFELTLKNAGIEFEEIYVSTDILPQGGISCTKVKIYTDCDRQRVVTALGGEKQDFEVEVINE